MLVVAINPGHDGAVAAVGDRTLLYSLESEKDTGSRHHRTTPMSILDLSERIGAIPDVIAMGGWSKETPEPLRGKKRNIGAGYLGAHEVQQRAATFFGTDVEMFSSSHIRSHIMMAAGMAPPDDAGLRAVLVWEGAEGTFYLLDNRWQIVREVPVLQHPGGRYSFVFAVADESKADSMEIPPLDDSGKLMALAAYGDPADADQDIKETVERLLAPDGFPAHKGAFSDLAIYNIGVEDQRTKIAAALLTERMFDVFARAAQEHLPKGIPLYISGGCGLNCEWNMKWRELGHFSSVFVPPCTNDSGSALGTALDALAAYTGDPRVEWNVYCGLEFERDREPRPGLWKKRPLDNRELADVIAAGHVVAWVQGRWEMGPRALGNRSLLAEPSRASTRDKLNEIKRREDYRPIAPCARLEDAGAAFSADFHDPYMLYFRTVTAPNLDAITHVDGSARVQTVTQNGNRPLYDLLTAYGERTKGPGVLCNTSLNFKGFGFINTASDLEFYCLQQGVDNYVIGNDWYQRFGRVRSMD